jgi:hypothetical protein
LQKREALLPSQLPAARILFVLAQGEKGCAGKVARYAVYAFMHHA